MLTTRRKNMPVPDRCQEPILYSIREPGRPVEVEKRAADYGSGWEPLSKVLLVFFSTSVFAFGCLLLSSSLVLICITNYHANVVLILPLFYFYYYTSCNTQSFIISRCFCKPIVVFLYMLFKSPASSFICDMYKSGFG